MMIQCFYHNFSYTYYLLLHIYVLHDIHNPPLIPFSAIIDISSFVNNSNFTLLFFRQTCHANLGADRK